MHREHRMISFAAGELPKPAMPEGARQPERPQTIEDRASERLRRMVENIHEENARTVYTYVHPSGPLNETVTPEILEQRAAMVKSAMQDVAPMLERLGAALQSAGAGSPEVNAILREITARLNAPLGAEASVRAQNDAIALATAINGMAIPGAPGRLRVNTRTASDGRSIILVNTGR